MTGFDIENIVRTAIRMKRIHIADENMIIKPKDMTRYEDNELLILETGRMGEPINGLQKWQSDVIVMFKLKMVI